MSAPREMRGVWVTGFEESIFLPDVESIALVRETGESWADKRWAAIDFDDERKIYDSLGLERTPQWRRCPHAIHIAFVGRRATEDLERYGLRPTYFAVDQLLKARWIGVVQTRGVAGYDRQCATPAPTAQEMKALDEADNRRLKESGQMISGDEVGFSPGNGH
jgi:hypothetical protein